MQDIFNLLPGLQDTETKDAFTVDMNDSMLSMYLSSIVRSIVALHDLVNNKIDLREIERDMQNKKAETKKQKMSKQADGTSPAAATTSK